MNIFDPKGENNLTGRTFGRWTVVGISSQNPVVWKCVCVCGRTQTIRTSPLKLGVTSSCSKCARIGVLRDNISGRVNGRLTVIGPITVKGRTRWQCRCSCGKEKIMLRCNVMKATSCGCLNRENLILALRRRKIHGLSSDPTYQSWSAMVSRCYNKKDQKYSRYGNRGITVCEYLRSTPLNLIALLGARPYGKTIDRIDNNVGYFCGLCAECLSNNKTLNVRWATAVQQARNRRSNVMVLSGNENLCLVEWAVRLGIPYKRLHARYALGHRGEKLFYVGNLKTK